MLARGHALEAFFPIADFTGHWSRQDGCAAYRGYLQQRITRDVVSHSDGGSATAASSAKHSTHRCLRYVSHVPAQVPAPSQRRRHDVSSRSALSGCSLSFKAKPA